MEEHFDIKAMEIARRFYLNPTHNGSLEFSKGGYIRLRHHNLGLIQGISTGFSDSLEGNRLCYHLNQADGENAEFFLNNYGYYSVEGSEDKGALLILSTATEREEIDFGTVRIQNTFPEHGVFTVLNWTHDQFIESLEDSRQIDYAWVINREAIKGLFQLHDVIMIQFTMCNPETGEFDADLFCPGYKLELNYRHLSDDFYVNVVNLSDHLQWSAF